MLCVAALLSSALVLPSLTLRTPASRSAPLAMMASGNDAIDFPALDGSEVRVGIIKARWHEDITDELLAGVKTALSECGVASENIFESEVPGSFELPLATRYLALSGTVDVVIPMGVLIKGDTYHFEVIADTTTSALMNVGLQTGVPVIFGVLTVNTEEQAKERASGKNNHGLQWGKAAVEMALLRASAIGNKGRKVDRALHRAWRAAILRRPRRACCDAPPATRQPPHAGRDVPAIMRQLRCADCQSESHLCMIPSRL